MNRDEYVQKLKDPRWQKKRLEILQRDKFACLGCFDDESTLHVHHRWYGPGEPWDITNDALVTLCESCHEIESAASRNSASALIQAAREVGFMAGDMDDIAAGFRGFREQFGTQDPQGASVAASVVRFMLSDFARFRKIEDDYFAHLAEVNRPPVAE